MLQEIVDNTCCSVASHQRLSFATLSETTQLMQ